MLQDSVRPGNARPAIATRPGSPSPMLRLLFLLARLELTAEQERQAVALCSAIDDWAELVRLAQDTYLLTIAYRLTGDLLFDN